jgi:hypothetical protein
VAQLGRRAAAGCATARIALRDLKQKTVFFDQKVLKTAQKQAENRPFLRFFARGN